MVWELLVEPGKVVVGFLVGAPDDKLCAAVILADLVIATLESGATSPCDDDDLDIEVEVRGGDELLA